jgi:hypothetical protein
MDIGEYLRLKGVKGSINTKYDSDSRFVCYFDLFEKIKLLCKPKTELVIVDSSKVQTQIITISDKSYVIIAYSHIVFLDSFSNILFFPDGTVDQTNIFESLWNDGYKNSNGDKIYHEAIKGSKEELILKVDCARASGYMNAPDYMSNKLLDYLKTLTNHTIGFEIFITFIIGHELGHQTIGAEAIDFSFLMNGLKFVVGPDADWVERHLLDLSSAFENQSTINEATADLQALILINHMYIENEAVDNRIIPIYLVILFNNFFFFHLVNEKFDVESVKEIIVRKSFCIHMLKRFFGINEDSQYYNLLCHIDSYLIESVNSIFEAGLKSDPESRVFLTKAITRMKYISKEYIPDGFNKNHTTDVNILRVWIEDLAMELTKHE